MKFTLRTDPAALSAIFNSPLSSTSRAAKCLLALHPFRFTGTHFKGEENLAADKHPRIPCPVATHTAVDVIQVAGELDIDSEGEEESYSESEEEEEELIPQQDSAQ